jgi:ribosomal protein S18 acetylase RimI-like enzyme
MIDRADRIALDDGGVVRLRPVVAADVDRLAAFFARLSGVSRDRRFLGPKPSLSPREVAYLADVDQVSHGAIVAVELERGDAVGEARYAAWPGRPQAADLAVTVRDDLQGRGLGRALTGRVVAQARENGFEVLTASTAWSNAPARGLLRSLGFRALGSDAGVLDLELALQAVADAGCVAC